VVGFVESGSAARRETEYRGVTTFGNDLRGSHMGRVGLCVTLAVVVSLLAAATALAGGGSIRVGKPHTFCGVKSHDCSPSYTIYQNDEWEASLTGHAPRGANGVAGFSGNITCKAKETAEKRAYSIDEQLQGGALVSPGKNFKVIYEDAAYGPTDTVCVYLIHNSTGKTFARASKKFTVLPQPTP
jgi:hypothetical protein